MHHTIIKVPVSHLARLREVFKPEDLSTDVRHGAAHVKAKETLENGIPCGSLEYSHTLDPDDWNVEKAGDES